MGRWFAPTVLTRGVHAFNCDAADPAAIKLLNNDVVSRFPTFDTLINNAGVMCNLKLAESQDLLDVTREITINFSGPVQMIQQFLPHLRTRPEALIVNVSSGLAFVPGWASRSTGPRATHVGGVG